MNLRKIVAKKAEAGTWLLQFTTTWTLGDPKEAITMIQRLKLGVYLTFEAQEPQLDLQGPADTTVDGEVVGTEAKVDGGGNVVSMTPKGGRGRKRKKTPEQEAKDQVAEGRRALPPADDPLAGDDQPPADEAAGDNPAGEA